MKLSFSLSSLSLLTALSSTLCCIVPVLAIVAGSSGLASSVSWLEPARPYLIGATALFLALAWCQKLAAKPQLDDCGCHVTSKTPFLHSKAFLGVVTVASALLLAFPSYAHLFLPEAKTALRPVLSASAPAQRLEVQIDGMTCTGCERHLQHELGKLDGVVGVFVSYESGKAVLDLGGATTTDVDKIMETIRQTGYEAVAYKWLQE